MVRRSVRITWGGEELVLLGERAVAWPRAATVFVADAHLGKPAAFRSLGVPVPEAATGADLNRLTRVLDAAGAGRLVVLGDLVHAKRGWAPEMVDAVSAWRARTAGVEVVLVRGNHDERAGDPPASWNVACVEGPWWCGVGVTTGGANGHGAAPGTAANTGDGAGFWCCHEPEDAERAASAAPGGPGGGVGMASVLCGHLHPAVALHGRGLPGMKAACFWFDGSGGQPSRTGAAPTEGPGPGTTLSAFAAGRTVRRAVLPAFGSFTGTSVVRPRAGDRVFVVGGEDGEVIEVGGLARPG